MTSLVEKMPGGYLMGILFFVSLGVNVILAIVAIMLGKRRIGNKKDNTPLVDYQISDDE